MINPMNHPVSVRELEAIPYAELVTFFNVVLTHMHNPYGFMLLTDCTLNKYMVTLWRIWGIVEGHAGGVAMFHLAPEMLHLFEGAQLRFHEQQPQLGKEFHYQAPSQAMVRAQPQERRERRPAIIEQRQDSSKIDNDARFRAKREADEEAERQKDKFRARKAEDDAKAEAEKAERKRIAEQRGLERDREAGKYVDERFEATMEHVQKKEEENEQTDKLRYQREKEKRDRERRHKLAIKGKQKPARNTWGGFQDEDTIAEPNTPFRIEAPRSPTPRQIEYTRRPTDEMERDASRHVAPNLEESDSDDEDSKTDPYKFLGLEHRGKTPIADIRTMSRVLKEIHSVDKRANMSEDEKRHAEKRLVEIDLALKILLDSERKRAFDEAGVIWPYPFEAWKKKSKYIAC
jgi:hypothetical protein